MKSTHSFDQGLSTVFRLWEEKRYDLALSKVEELLTSWPGNAQLHLLWGSLVQLQENPTHSLDEVKAALQRSAKLDRNSPAGPIELGHFLDGVDDDPQGASKAFADGIATARRFLIEGLLGQGKAMLQLDKREEAVRCLMEVLYLTDIDSASGRANASEPGPDVLLRDLVGRGLGFQLKGPYADKIEDLLKEILLNRSA